MKRITCTLVLAAAITSCSKGNDVNAETTAVSTTEAQLFAAHAQAAMQQMAGTGTQIVIPEAKVRKIQQIAAEVTQGTGVHLSRMYPLEQSLVVTDVELGQKNKASKGLFIWGTTTNQQQNKFDWTVMALVDLNTFDVLNYRLNTAVGKTERTWATGQHAFMLMNDYMHLTSASASRGQYVPSVAPRRVLTGSIESALHRPDDSFLAEFTQVGKGTYFLNHHLDVFKAREPELGASSVKANFTRIGGLK